MTDRNQFEAMLEALINEDQEQAKEIFHNIVVAKSREIYEELLESDFAEATEDEEEKTEEGMEGEEVPVEPTEGFDDEEGSDDEPDDEEGDVGGDAGDAFGDEAEGEDLSDEEQTDRILDLEDALEQLKAEFEQLMAGEEGEEHMGGMDDMGGMDAMGGEEDEMEQMFEYVDKVALPKHGDNGVNTKSLIDNMKNDMGGTNANIAKSFSTEKGGTQGGLLNPSTKEENFGNINVPGGNAGKTSFKKKEPGHGAEKAGAKETADNKQSLLKQAKK
jgi:hypothetical protein